MSAFYDCPGTWTGTYHPRRTHRLIDTCPRAIQAIRTCVATLAFIIITGYRRPPVTLIRRISGSADSRTPRPADWAAVLDPAVPAARRPISARRSRRHRCWGPKCVHPRSSSVLPLSPPPLGVWRLLRQRVSADMRARVQPVVAETRPPTLELAARWEGPCHLERFRRYLRRLHRGKYLYDYWNDNRLEYVYEQNCWKRDNVTIGRKNRMLGCLSFLMNFVRQK
jgi:hypothetical protein